MGTDSPDTEANAGTKYLLMAVLLFLVGLTIAILSPTDPEPLESPLYFIPMIATITLAFACGKIWADITEAHDD